MYELTRYPKKTGIVKMRNINVCWFVVLVYFSWPLIAMGAATLEEGVAAVEKQDYETAFSVFKQLAEQGNAEAQYNLAILYRQGKGVTQDKEVALKWFEKSAALGLASAEYYLGHLYDNGDGVTRDPATAVSWYKKAAEKGNPLAQSNLGVAYASGEGVKQDIIKAYVWFSLAASQGLTAALENRNLLKKEMSEQLQSNAQRLTREYFSKYVSPFQPPPSMQIRRPETAEAHQGLNQPHSQQQSFPHSGHPPMGNDKHNH